MLFSQVVFVDIVFDFLLVNPIVPFDKNQN